MRKKQSDELDALLERYDQDQDREKRTKEEAQAELAKKLAQVRDRVVPVLEEFAERLRAKGHYCDVSLERRSTTIQLIPREGPWKAPRGPKLHFSLHDDTVMVGTSEMRTAEDSIGRNLNYTIEQLTREDVEAATMTWVGDVLKYRG